MRIVRFWWYSGEMGSLLRTSIKQRKEADNSPLLEWLGFAVKRNFYLYKASIVIVLLDWS